MDLVHLHLVLTHFPISGVIFALVFFLIAMTLNRREFLTAAMVILVLSALLAIPLYVTGEATEDAIEHLAGVSEKFIEQHEDAAKVSFVLLEVLGLFAALGLALQFISGRMLRLYPQALLLGTLITTFSIAWTSNLGGKIRHTEIRNVDVISNHSKEIGSREEEREHDD